MFISQDDEKDLIKRQMSLSSLLQQIHQFTKDTKPVKLERPCSPADGIVVLNGSDCHRYQKLFETDGSRYSKMKFVPASGAASRMFKHLHNYSPTSVSELAEEFIVNFDMFPFVSLIEKKMQEQELSLSHLLQTSQWDMIVDFILQPHGLNYNTQLKGMVVFHKYDNELRTAFEEHLLEAVRYGKQADGRCRIHFTISPQHIESVSKYLNEKINSYVFENIEVEFSTQNENTDTIALDKNNEPVRDENGRLFFRPSGHGALIQNLGQIDADIIFIKNIDNVTTTARQEESVFYKQVLAGVLIELKSEVNRFMEMLTHGDDELLEEALEFIQLWFQPGLPLGMNTTQLKEYAHLRLDRPLRVCGMVRNEGEPGGGPFWVKMTGGYLSKQIVEKSQVDLHDLQQSKILSSATHFNPVDIVCSIKNRDGVNYALDQFIDYSTGFVSEKFHQGQVIKALEWPGLWNGAMALWNTVFVEVPVSTFNPVKTVNDLLRPGHQ